MARERVYPATLWRWRQGPGFKARVDGLVAEVREEVRRVRLADLHRRVEALDVRWRQMLRVVDERAADPEMAGVPGGSTGLLVRTSNSIGSGESARLVHEYEVDVAQLREIRKHEQPAARELGHWTEETEANVRMGAIPPIRIVEVRHSGTRDRGYSEAA